MSSELATLTQRVDCALSGQGLARKRMASPCWAGAMQNGARHHLEVRRDDDWLLFYGRAEGNSHPTPVDALWDALRHNAGDTTGIKATLTKTGRLLLRSELLLLGGEELERRVRGVIEAFHLTWDGRTSPVPEPPDDWAAEVERRCAESGWSCIRRSSGRLTIGLETSPVFQTTVTPAGAGMRLVVEVIDLGSQPASCQTAAAVLAMETSGRIRLVRAVADEHQNRIGFSVCLADTPTTEEFAAGLGGLSAAVAATSEALAAMQNETLAGDYLATRGWTARKQNPKRERIST